MSSVNKIICVSTEKGEWQLGWLKVVMSAHADLGKLDSFSNLQNIKISRVAWVKCTIFNHEFFHPQDSQLYMEPIFL
jgi:hypothetical protein